MQDGRDGWRALFGIFGHCTERITGSAPGPAKVATRMVLLRMGSTGVFRPYPLSCLRWKSGRATGMIATLGRAQQSRVLVAFI